tara:strand:+ start:497 stop:814 length:318 start_codon:yes stop_codon:yes gene_type:complete
MNSQDNEIGVFFGGTNYIGDVGPTTYVNPFPATHSLTNEKSSFTTVFGILYRKNLTNRFGLRVGFNIAEIESSVCGKVVQHIGLKEVNHLKIKSMNFILVLTLIF